MKPLRFEYGVGILRLRHPKSVLIISKNVVLVAP